tara:strand:- start:13650 stop:14492 length:843 start_codon:yes stop_codon:yes gene_type:complete
MVKNTRFGVLYIVSTPIGNLKDISKRALECLSSVDLCAAEDTRKSKLLFDSYNIKTKLVSYHKFSEKKRLEYLTSKLKGGLSIALISNAGTPVISDPGQILIKRAQEESINIVPIPGPSSPISALSVSGFSADKFSFYGFPPRKKKDKNLFMKSLISEEKTSIVFESKRRIIDFLLDLKKLDSQRNIFVAREMTKLHESFYKGNIDEVIKKISNSLKVLKGEFVVVVEGKNRVEKEIILETEQEEVIKILLKSMNRKEALSLSAKAFNIKRNILYSKFIH